MKNIKFFVAALLLVTAGIISFTSNIQKGYATSSWYRGNDPCQVMQLDDQDCSIIGTYEDCEMYYNLPHYTTCSPQGGGGGGEQSEYIYKISNEYCTDGTYLYRYCENGCCLGRQEDKVGLKDVCVSGNALEDCTEGECDLFPEWTNECEDNVGCSGDCF